MYEAATKHGINPLELLVRVQMEQGLVSKKTASDESITLAFGCGCPHSPVCSPKYEGFANQAECAAGTLSRSMDRALTTNGTASGWKKGEEKLTQDMMEIVPANAATAALYTYTPWVGEAGGGKKGIGGVSLHHAVWTRFADAVGYGALPNNDTPREQPNEVLEAGADPNNGGNDGNQGGEGQEADAGPAPGADAGAPSEEPGPDSADAGPTGSDGSNDGTPAEDDGEDDEDILSEGNAPPATNAPPPRQTGSRSKASRTGDDDLPEATEEELSAGKKKASGGCSSSGGNASDASLAALVMAAAGLVAKRRRRRD
jgi:MYXO-CTERM domain-containing protein